MKHFLLIGLSLIGFLSIGQQKSVIDFQEFADSQGLKFEMPEDYSVAEVKENRDLWYSFAIINADSSMEVRYTIWSLESEKKQYEESLKDSSITMVPHNNIYRGRVEANALNMTGGNGASIGSFPTAAVQREFNADAGGSSFFLFNCQFGEGYEFGQFVFLHKDDVADVIITFMSNDKSTHSDLMDAAFHSLVFK